MPIRRKPGEVIETDWSGNTLAIQDRASGEKLTVYVFVAVLPYSQMFYAEGFLNMKSESLLTAHIHAFEYLSIATRLDLKCILLDHQVQHNRPLIVNTRPT